MLPSGHDSCWAETGAVEETLRRLDPLTFPHKMEGKIPRCRKQQGRQDTKVCEEPRNVCLGILLFDVYAFSKSKVHILLLELL